MIIVNNEALQARLVDDGFDVIALQPEFDIPDASFARLMKELRNREPILFGVFPNGDEDDSQARNEAAFRWLTHVDRESPPAPQSVACSAKPCEFRPEPIDLDPICGLINLWGRRLLIALGIIALILAVSGLAHAQNVNPAMVVATCGTPPAAYPSAGTRAELTTDTNGNLCAGVTVSATISTAGLAVTLGAGTSGTGSGYVAATYNTSAAPAYTNGTFNSLSADLAGNLRVNATVTPAALQNVNVTQVGNTSVSAGLLAVVGAVSSGTTAVGGPVIVGALSGTAATSLVMSTTGSGLKVDPSGYTSPISAASLPLPSLASTSTKQSDGSQKTQIVDGSGNIQPAGDTQTRGISVNATFLSSSIGVQGNLTNNNAVPAATNVGALVALANATAPTNTEGRQTLISETISGYVRTTLPAVTVYTNSAVSGVAVTAFATSAIVLDYIDCQNSSTSANSFVQIFNTTSASVTPGSTSPTEQHMAPFGGGFVLPNLHTPYSNGVSLIATTTAGGATGQSTICTLRAYVP